MYLEKKEEGDQSMKNRKRNVLPKKKSRRS